MNTKKIVQITILELKSLAELLDKRIKEDGTITSEHNIIFVCVFVSPKKKKSVINTAIKFGVHSSENI